MEPALLFALIGVLGIGSQWLAWRLQMPAIVLMLVAGLLAGPATGLINPAQDFGDLFRPLVSVAVAVILFEGGLTLNLRELRHAGKAVRQLVFIGAPLGWLLSALAIHYAAGLSWASSAVFGGILVVTGPTVITPLLRQARLSPRPSSILKWEAIVNDPVGALAAVLAFEIVLVLNGAGSFAEAAGHLVLGVGLAIAVGLAAGWVLAWAFKGGLVPEYMKVPVLFGLVLVVYASTDHVLHESGLLAVTVMGIYIANAHLPSLDELRRFKEHVTVILVSGVFILLAASLEISMIKQLDWHALAFVFVIIFLARPITVLASLTGTGLGWKEKSFIAWIGPRGVVAVAVSGLFGARLTELGIEDGALLAPLAFVLVTATVVLHGFSMKPLAEMLGLTSTEPPGVLIVGASDWTAGFAEELKKAGLPVIVTDNNWYRLRPVRLASVTFFQGEVLSEAAEHTIGLNRYGTVLAATDNDGYNALVCTDFAPEFGRNNVFQIGRHEALEGERDLPVTLGGRTFGAGLSFEEFANKRRDDWIFSRTGLSEEYDIEQYRADREDSVILGVIRANGTLELAGRDGLKDVRKDDKVLAYGPRRTTQADVAES